MSLLSSGHLGFLFHGFCVHLGLLHWPLCDVISSESLQLFSRKLFKFLLPTLPLQRAKSWKAWYLTLRGREKGVTFNQWPRQVGVRKPSSSAAGELRHSLQSRCFRQDPAVVSPPGILLGFHPSLSCLSHCTTRQEHSCNNLLYINACPRRTQAKTVNLRVVLPLCLAPGWSPAGAALLHGSSSCWLTPPPATAVSTQAPSAKVRALFKRAGLRDLGYLGVSDKTEKSWTSINRLGLHCYFRLKRDGGFRNELAPKLLPHLMEPVTEKQLA